MGIPDFKMGKQTDFHETAKLLHSQKKKFLTIITIISTIGTAFLISTIYLAVRAEKGYPAARVEYHVWNSPKALQGTRNFMKTLKVPDNSSVYTVMEHAAIQSAEFKFEYKMFDGLGRYITSIGGVKSSDDTYWALYKLSSTPNADSPPKSDDLVSQGIDDLRVQEGEVYLFWLTSFDASSPHSKLINPGNPSPKCVN